LLSRTRNIPPYLQRQKYIPFGPEDFGDGGAFPEIHVVQYPLNMGKPGGNNSAIVAVTVDGEGQVKFDAIVKQGRNMNKIVQSSLTDIKEKEADLDMLALPQEKEEMETAEKTRNALELLLNGKIKSSLPTTVNHTKNIEEPTYIRYTTDPNAPG
jgi:SNW domain-containing protein 1